MGDAQRLQVGNDSGSRVEAELGGELNAVGRDRNSATHQHTPRRQDTDQGGMTSRASMPQMAAPVVNADLRTISVSDRLVSSRSVAPSPMRQFAVSRPLSSACASPNAAPTSRGVISL